MSDTTPPLAFVAAPFHEANQPRCIVLLDGQWTMIPIEYTITLGLHGASDTAEVIVPNAGNPDWTQLLYRGANAGNAGQPVYLQIFAGLVDGTQPVTISNLTLRFWGVVDQYVIDDGPPNDQTTFTCRSLAAPLIDTKLVFPLTQNYTTVQFIQKAAKDFGMPTPIIDLIAPPITMQQVLAQELIAGVHSYTYWEMIVRASLQDDCDVWVDASGAIHYVARTRQTRPKATFAWGRDFTSARLTHAPQFSKNVQIDIKIYNPQTKSATITRAVLAPDGSSMQLITGTRTVTSQKVFGTLSTVTNTVSNPFAGIPVGFGTSTVSTTPEASGSFNASAGQKAASDSGKERYVLWLKAGTSPAQALAQAQQMFLSISEHEYTIDAVIPITTSNIHKFLVTNAGGVQYLSLDVDFIVNGLEYMYFHGGYWVRELVEHFGVDVGFYWGVTALNHEPPPSIS